MDVYVVLTRLGFTWNFFDEGFLDEPRWELPNFHHYSRIQSLNDALVDLYKPGGYFVFGEKTERVRDGTRDFRHCNFLHHDHIGVRILLQVLVVQSALEV